MGRGGVVRNLDGREGVGEGEGEASGVGFEWGVQLAGRRSKKRRAIGRMLRGIRKELMERETKIEVEGEGIIMGRVMQGKKI